MPMQRVRATALARLLNSADRPIYVLDSDRTIVFCNQKLLAAVGPSAAGLLGRRCVYTGHSPDSAGVEATAAGLCPPPQAMAGEAVTATVSWLGEDAALHQRLARFIPLESDSNPCRDIDEKATGDGLRTIAVIVIVGAHDLQESDARPLGQTIDKPIPETADLHRVVREFYHKNASLYRIGRLIGSSAAIRLVRRRVELAASTRAGVLIVGPPGSGRQHVAHTIHYARNGSKDGSNLNPDSAENAATGSLIPLSCPVLGADLIRSTVNALGAADRADAAETTLLLNEAGQLPIEIQSHLAAVFSEKTFLPQVIATSRQPLADLVQKGQFREDLAAILSTIVIELPPLAKRRADLPLLAQMFVERENAESDKQIGGLSSEALDCLDGYDWPGNVDELALFIAEAHRNATSALIEPKDLPKRIHLAADAAAHPKRPLETIVLDEFLAQVERELIERAMKKAKNNKAKAARMLGLTRPRLYRRLIQLGIEEEPSNTRSNLK